MNFSRPLMRLFNALTETSKSGAAANSIPTRVAIKELHAQLIRTLKHTDPSSISEVIKFYAFSQQYSHKAQLVLNQIYRPTLLVWNYMIRGFSHSDEPGEAIRLYNSMYHHGLALSHTTLIFAFKACARIPDFWQGIKVHVYALKLGFEGYLFVSNALIHMYACLCQLGFAQKVFEGMSERDIVSWNSLICAYCQCNRFKEVLDLFEMMQSEKVKGDSVTMMKVILACRYLSDSKKAAFVVKYIDENCIEIDLQLGNTLVDMHGRHGSVDLARSVFDQMKEKNIVSWNTMIKGYAKARNLFDARNLFEEMPARDVISWTSMITGYAQAQQYDEALKLFEEMIVAQVKPDEITIASVLSACAHLGSLDVGEAVHEYIKNHGIKSDVYVGNALIDMYCKCGTTKKALLVFREMKSKDSVSWTSIISGLAVNGFADSVLELFSEMLDKNVQPTHGVFVGILLACAHTGLVDKGLEYFERMRKLHGLVPEMKHYGCVVDLLSRSGHLERAYKFITKMPVVPDVVVWRILLSACKVHGNVELAEVVKNKLVDLDPFNSGNYVLSLSAYAGSNRWDDVLKTRELMEEISMKKPRAYSLIEVNDLESSESRE